MANKVLLKKSSVTGKIPTTTDLDYGELALNYTDGKLYYKTATNTIGAFATGSGTVTSVSGTGTVSGLTLSGTVTSSGNLTLGGTLALTSGDITTGLGYTPLNKAGDTVDGAFTVTDSLFTIQDETDNTKKAQFQLSGITTGTTRTYTLPNASVTLAGTNVANTFSSTNTFSAATVTVGTSTATSTYGLGTGATLSGNTKTVNIGTNGVSGSTTSINIGSTNGTSVTANGTWTFGSTIVGSITGNAATATTASDSALLNGYASGSSGGGNTILRTAANGYLHLNNWLHPANGSGLFYDAGVHFYEVSNYMYSSTGFTAQNDMRAPVFYDSNNTGYYADPASTSRMSGINFDVLYYAADTSYGFIGASVYADTINSGYAGDSLEINYVRGTWAGISHDSLRAPLYYDYNDTTYYLDPASETYLYGGIWNNGAHGNSRIINRLLAANNGASTGEVRLQQWCSEPGITWDWAGFGYNVINDGAGAYGFGRPNTGFGQAYMRFGTGGQWYFYTANTSGTRYTNMYLAPGNGVETYGRLYNDSRVDAPVFYDSDNTGYYVDPASSSYLYSLSLSGAVYFQPNTWIQLNSDYGLYWPNNNGAHLHANTLSNYSSIAIRGNRGGYGGIYDQYSGWAWMNDSAGNGGFYREANGLWSAYYSFSNDCWGFSTSTTFSFTNAYGPKGFYAGTSMYSPIYYDASNTAYYADPASTSNFNVTKTVSIIETKAAIAASAIDVNLGNYFTKTISGATTFTANAISSGNVSSFILELTNAGSAAITWFSGVKWAGGTAPTLTSSGVDILGFYTHDGGTTWRGLVLAKDSK